MNEKTMKERLIRITAIAGIISALLIVCAGVVLGSLRDAQKNSYHAQIESRVMEYKISLQRSLQANLEILRTLSSFIENHTGLTFDSIAQGLRRSNDESEFLRMGYYGVDGNTIRVTMHQEIERDVKVEDLDAALRSIIEQSWQGEEQISAVYEDTALQKTVIAYSVPVTDGSDKIVGALVGVEDIKSMRQLLEQSSMQIGWICEDGTFITQTNQARSLFEGYYLTPQEKENTRKAIANRQSYSTTFQFEGEKYPCYLEPLEINGWYLTYIDGTYGTESPIYSSLIIAYATFAFIIILCILLGIYAFRLIYNNNSAMRQLAYYDKLTGSYNFDHFQSDMAKILEKDKDYSVVVLNIRRFQYINEIFGRKIADKLLCDIAKLLQEEVAQNERCCRYMGDQFYLLVHGRYSEHLKGRIEALMTRISRLSEQINRNYPIVLYAGIASGETGTEESKLEKELLYQAEFALKQVKSVHVNEIVFYDDQIHKTRMLQTEIESNMKYALLTGEFHMFLQPKVDLNTGELCGAEALVRWIREKGPMIYPDQFIPMFERNGFCAQLDLYMVDQACRCLRAWMDAGKDLIPISVNQSKLLFYQSDYVEKLCEITSFHQISPKWIILEILEGLAAESMEELNKTIERLQEKGFHISLDDFGCGYSSLNVLASLNINEVKLDRNFLMSMSNTNQERQQSMMRNVVHLAKELGIATVVEGVEGAENEKFIQELGCDIAQGYYYSRPISVSEFEEKYLQA